MRSHIRNALSFPTLSASFPDGWTATELTRPLWPFNTRRTAQSRARNKHRVPSSEADNRCDRDGKVRWVIEPIFPFIIYYPKKSKEHREVLTFMMHETTDFLSSPEIPNFNNFVRTAGRKPFSTLRRCSDGFDTRYVCWEYKYRLQVEL